MEKVLAAVQGKLSLPRGKEFGLIYIYIYMSLLQIQTTRMFRQHQTRPKGDLKVREQPERQKLLQIDFRPVLTLERGLARVKLPLLQQWHDVPMPDWIRDGVSTFLPWEGQKPLHFEFFTDGSRTKGGQVGASVVALVDTASGRNLVGTLAQHVDFTHAFHGEHSAITWALVWAIHLSWQHEKDWGDCAISFSFTFDCTASGYQAAGWWKSKQFEQWNALIRSFGQVLQSRHGFDSVLFQHTYAHVGTLWNEFADQLAKHAARTLPKQFDTVWLQWIKDECDLQACQWLWALPFLRQGHQSLPALINGMLCHPVEVNHTPPPVSPQEHTHSDMPRLEVKQCLLDLRIATANVLTLLVETRAFAPTTGARQLALMQQFDELGFHIVAVQETRHKKISQNNDLYHVVGHPGDKGKEGIQIWFSKKRPLTQGAKPITLQDVKLVHSEVNLLIAKVSTHGIKFVIVAAHAPHSDHTVQVRTAFWESITRTLRCKCSGWFVIFAGDSNGHLGSEISSAVGDHCPAPENNAGEAFHEWMIQNKLFAPSTFPKCHVGESSTFLSVRGQFDHRLDYICLPLEVPFECVTTWTETKIDLGLQRTDHMVAAARIQLPWKTTLSRFAPERKRLDGDEVGNWLNTSAGQFALHDALAIPSWSYDIHDQADNLAMQTYHVCPKTRDRKKPFRKRHLLEETQSLIRQKQFQFRHWRLLNATKKKAFLRMFFCAWKQGEYSDRHHTPFALQQQQRLDRALAQTERCLRLLGTQVRSAVRRDDAAFFEQLAFQAGEVYDHEGMVGLWRKIKAVLPKHQSRRQFHLIDMGQALHDHFAQLEAGTRMRWNVLERQCRQREIDEATLPPCAHTLTLQDLPTLFEVEHHCRKQSAHKAPGPDGICSEVCKYGAAAVAPAMHNLLLKCVLNGKEPVSFKGGYLHSIYKGKGPRTDPAMYRGILLANTFAKISHAWCRRKLLPTFQKNATPGQLGGLPSQQTSSAIHVLKLHAKRGQELKVSTAVVFLDVKSAFHHMIRDFVFSVTGQVDRAKLTRFLHPDDHSVDDIAQKIFDAHETHREDMPWLLRRYLHDVHCDTWYQLIQDCFTDTVICTDRGTRPGSPLADVGFNLLMSQLLHELNLRLQDMPQYLSGMQCLMGDYPALAWVDDVAVPLAATSPEDLIPLVRQVASSIHEIFYGAGLLLNYSRGKTEAVVSFRGKGADQQRLSLFSGGEQPGIVCSTASHVFTLRICGSYKHLGSQYTLDADPALEIKHRIGMAKAAYTELKRAVFLNRHISPPGRIQLVNSLIVTKLMYGASVWTDVTSATLKRLEAFLMRLYRSILDIGFWKHETGVSDHALRAYHELPTFRLLWTKMRLGYLQHISRHGALHYIDAMCRELPSRRGWLHEASADLRWLQRQVELPFDVPTNEQEWKHVLPQVAQMSNWKSTVKRAIRIYLSKEKVAWQTHHFHDLIFQEMEDAGLQPIEKEQPALLSDMWICDRCTATFDSKQKLAVHKARKHGCLSEERDFVQSTVCAGCLYNFWTTRRLQQHLATRSNGCFLRLQGARVPDESVNIELPTHLVSVKGLSAFRAHHGPLRPTPKQREITQVRFKIQRQRDIAHDIGADLRPEAFGDTYTQLCSHFEACLCNIVQTSEQLSHDFTSFLFPDLLEVSDAQIGCSFHHWWRDLCMCVQRRQSIPDFLFLELERLDADLGFDHCLCLLQEQEVLLANLQDKPDDDILFTRETGPSRPRDYLHELPDGLRDEFEREQSRKQMKWDYVPRPSRLLQPEFKLFIHLYSGRRRRGDIHDWLKHFMPDDSNCIVLSIDTAISAKMNVTCPKVWTFLCDAGKTGHIHGLALGPPCETWTSARHESIPGERGPRPLRSALCPWGIFDITLTRREIQQIGVGTLLLLRGLWLCIVVGLCGGSIVLEHPGTPPQPDRASIWRTAVLETLLSHFKIFSCCRMEQWLFASPGVKPTNLMYANCDLEKYLRMNADYTRVKPTCALIGKNHDGSYKTAAAKEYPVPLCRAISQALLANRGIFGVKNPVPSWQNLAEEFASLASSPEGGAMMPDYQPS